MITGQKELVHTKQYDYWMTTRNILQITKYYWMTTRNIVQIKRGSEEMGSVVMQPGIVSPLCS